ncbi:hypothetical protein RJ639_036705 [Escallonia herrerae]|uniref:RING-type E3 ubiquitin transferase n=1 Tax=Escallonia herrerae TaxID=1293975 RepID=A0AA88WSI4_9ASTE|nr:hypothetical protein RJ639_036705 [Escallonia herrerae]
MSFVFRGTRPDIESGVPGYHPERRTMRVHASRPVNTKSFAFLVTVLLLFMILNSNHMSLNFLLWLVLGVFLMATSLRMYATWQHLQAYYQAHAAAASGLLGHTELRLHMPPSVALATRGRLQGLRLQLALLDREFDDLDYDNLRALDSDNVPSAFSMSDEEINALPVHMYKVACPQRLDGHNSWKGSVERRNGVVLEDEGGVIIGVELDQYILVLMKAVDVCLSNSGGSIKQQASSSGSAEKNQVAANSVGGVKASEDELTCSVCLEQVITGELVRSLPCLHQFHASCIDPWLRQQGTCPVCKYKAGSGWRENAERAMDASHMV